jgi:hypothetical protein
VARSEFTDPGFDCHTGGLLCCESEE